jgi:hypothetical protein
MDRLPPPLGRARRRQTLKRAKAGKQPCAGGNGLQVIGFAALRKGKTPMTMVIKASGHQRPAPRIFDPVLAAADRMLDVLPAERARLEAAIANEPFAGNSEREYADALLGQVLVEGFGWGLENDRSLLKRLHAQGLIDVIRTPAGAVFSSPGTRALMRRNEVQ